MSEFKYRPDIDGLRGLAVLAVVLYHLKIPGITGGFVGVDIFFVISGFLITRIIATEVERGTFSLVGFYERRARRILPAFFVMLAICTPLASWLLMPGDFRLFMKSLVGSVLFVSNMMFAIDQGYFSEIPSYNPLLHTWSLSVEEQFYIALPLLMLLLARLRQRPVFIIGLLALLSFVVAVWLVGARPNAAYYFTPGRAWELLVGSLLALGAVPAARPAWLRELIGALGLASMVGSILLLSADLPFPGVNALYPCLGAALLIHAGTSGGSLASRLLAWRGIAFVGLISYSLYLWHWPLIIFAQYVAIDDLTALQRAGLLASSLALAVASWRYVEQPVRHWRPGTPRPVRLLVITGAATASLLLLAAASLAVRSLPNDAAAILAAAKADQSLSFNPDRSRCLAGLRNRQSRKVEDVASRNLCALGEGTSAPTFVLWGDSHAEAIRTGVDLAARRLGRAGYFAGHIGCPPALGTIVYNMPGRDDCTAFNQEVMNLLDDPAIETVILHSRWPLHFGGHRYKGELGAHHVLSAQGAAGNRAVLEQNMRRTVAELAARRKRIVIVAGVPEIGLDVPSAVGRASYFGRSLEVGVSRADYTRRHEVYVGFFQDLARTTPIRILYPDAEFCREERCRVEVEGKLLYVDDDHLSVAGAAALAPMLEAAFEDVDPRTAPAAEGTLANNRR